ncbi:MAG: DUF1844 domain-containing protein [Planctomycetes bacterium]|nr:DUF1844 domain-containing protein [Planctomycetota bacterium]
MAENDKKPEKKIIVDEDWKAEAQKEKEVLKAQEKVEHEHEEEEAKEEAKDKEHPALPPADFLGLVSMLATQVYFALGLLATEGDEKRKPDLVIAQYNIDMLDVIETKSKGNLTDQESKLLTDTLHQARMAFVKFSQ